MQYGKSSLLVPDRKLTCRSPNLSAPIDSQVQGAQSAGESIFAGEVRAPGHLASVDLQKPVLPHPLGRI